MKTRLALATAVVLTLTSLTAWIPGPAAGAAHAATPSATRTPGAASG